MRVSFREPLKMPVHIKAPTMSEEMVLVPKAELERLQKLDESIKQKKNKRLQILHEKAVANPDIERKKALERYYRNKDQINARRKETREKKKAAAAAASAGDTSAPPETNPPDSM
jgi:hypothetical protein